MTQGMMCEVFFLQLRNFRSWEDSKVESSTVAVLTTLLSLAPQTIDQLNGNGYGADPWHWPVKPAKARWAVTLVTLVTRSRPLRPRSSALERTQHGRHPPPCSHMDQVMAYSWNQSEEKVKVPLYRDPANLGLSLHFWTSGFVGSGIAASINGVFAGYLNVPSYVVNGALSLNALPVIFSAVLGALSDAKPILGFHRRPYMAFGWGLIFLSISLISCLGLPDPYYCHTPDGNYLLHDPPCNPEAAHAYVPLLCCFLLASTGMAIASSAGDGLLVQIAKSENEDRRGETQAMMLMVQPLGAKN